MKNNEPVSAILHLIGALLGIVALVTLILSASSPWHVVGYSIFGSTIILLYLASTVFHFTWGKWKEFFRRIDLSMIFVLIAGTYTPLCLTVLRGGWGWSLLGIVWSLAVIGIIVVTRPKINNTLNGLLYIGLGWLMVIAIVPLFKAIPMQGMILLFGGGLLYTLGAIYCGLDRIIPRTRWWGLHELFHILVLAGTFSHYWLMLKFL